MFSVVVVFKIQMVEMIITIMHSKMEHSSLKCVKVLLQPLWLKTLTMYITSMGCLRYYIAIWNNFFEKSVKYIQHYLFDF